jgi:DNA-binding protein H-NS
MAAINVDKLSLKDLLDLEERVKRAISVARERERSDLRQQMMDLAEKKGFSVNELFGAARGARGKSAAKYANPDNRGETWTGRGRKPNWLVAKLKKGEKLESFAIR